MKTKIIKINPLFPKLNKLKEAAKVIVNGGLVAFPTETVYGLGANAFNKNAIKKIFLAKGRPGDNPLIVHIYKKEQLFDLSEDVPSKAQKLINYFWPGPLTIILKKSSLVPDEVTAGLQTVAIRMPKNKIALNLIKMADLPIAAPSANLSGKPSPTTGKHVIDDLNGKIDLIIDGGKVNIGLESTVVDLTSDIPEILRPGKITKKQLEKIIGKVNGPNKNKTEKPKSPGMKYRHYSPKAKVLIAKNNQDVEKICKKYNNEKIKQLKYINKSHMAKNLFKDFRLADKKGYTLIIVKEIKDQDFGNAIMDRLRKASNS